MGRSRTYNEAEVLVTLAKLFAESGFEATSIDVIATATGMKRGSIYQAFGSKANLFRMAFEHALENTAAPDTLSDLLIVALWERAAADPQVRTTAERAIAHLEESSGSSIANIIERRLLVRAGLIGGGNHGTDSN